MVGPFNGWDGRLHPMRLHPANGVWDLFLPGVSEGALYKFEILDRNGALLALKSDPLARAMEPPPANACGGHVSRHSGNDDAGMRTPRPAGSPSLMPALSRAPAVSMTPLRRMMKAPSSELNSLMVSDTLSSSTLRCRSVYPLKGLRIICSE